jgi:hypothetical protein
VRGGDEAGLVEAGKEAEGWGGSGEDLDEVDEVAGGEVRQDGLYHREDVRDQSVSVIAMR